VNCTVTKTVTVTVNPTVSPVLTCGTPSPNSVTFSWAALSNATSYTLSYTVNGGAAISGGSVTNPTFTVNGLNPNDSVKLTVTPVGTGCFRPRIKYASPANLVP